MAIGGHADGIGWEAEAADELGDFRGGERGVERFGVEPSLVRRAAGGVGINQMLQFGLAAGAGQVAVE